MSFSLTTIRVDGSPTATLISAGRHYAIADLAPELLTADPAGGLLSVLQVWPESERALIEADARIQGDPDAYPMTPTPARLEDWLTPIQYPGKVVCTGFNYQDHVARDAGRPAFVKEDNIPVFFLKPPRTTLVGQGRSVRFPSQTEKFDYEIELAVVIGKRGKRIPLDAATDHIAGYTIGLDLSARDWQRHPKHVANFDLFGGKAFDDSCPLGPAIIPARFIGDAELHVQFWLNGELRQDATTADMIWTVTEQISLISEHTTLEPGDVIMTGTPSGVGLSTGTWLAPGDKLEGQISELGTLAVEVADEA